ncbi:tRNA-splicing endonuclease subunit Sen34 isoform X2 [Octopus bimaculoides]|uniref:tRNA-splicing endonuclease subunit Sen34 n=1 Tax=Octopus bimaculoides TaxID=37653 RepID=A0A0L8IBV1_OCTBM|nr:tRNA-splicing endonuclease subunit Sen34 isoform X2 [Octopus bimaculoides]|eukprot:XP_014781421.1 PREDICTED: tRNA-splicing endonuclease subunit Sen34-like isoform X2 [Octopus bimaculoides]
MEESLNEKVIKIYVDGDVGLVWNNEDVMLLRKQHRIVGTLVGALPRAPCQNNLLGLPLQLSPEEVSVLLEKGIAHLIQEVFPNKLSPEEIQAYEEQRHQSYTEQIPLYQQERRMDTIRNLSNIVKGKKAKRNQQLEHQKQLGMEIDDTEFEKEVEIDVDEIKIPPIDEKNSVVQIFTENPWINRTYKEAEWIFPSNAMQNLRYRVFKEFWEQGYFLTHGSKFGGDFLVYPGDPARYHSFFIVRCVKQTETIPMMDIAAIERLGTSVRKTVVLCSLNDVNEVDFISLQWRGMGWKTTG